MGNVLTKNTVARYHIGSRTKVRNLSITPIDVNPAIAFKFCYHQKALHLVVVLPDPIRAMGSWRNSTEP